MCYSTIQYTYSLLSDSEPAPQPLNPNAAAPPTNAKLKPRKKAHKGKRSKDKSPVPMPSNVMVQDLDDIVDISITTPNDADSAVGGAVACRNDGGSEELAASDPRSTLGQIDNSSLCEADVPPSAGKKVGYLNSSSHARYASYIHYLVPSLTELFTYRDTWANTTLSM